MAARTSRLVVERVDSLSRRPSLVWVMGRLEGDSLHIGDVVVIESAERAEIKSIEMHSVPGTVTIALDAGLKSRIRSGSVLSTSGADAVEADGYGGS